MAEAAALRSELEEARRMVEVERGRNAEQARMIYLLKAQKGAAEKTRSLIIAMECLLATRHLQVEWIKGFIDHVTKKQDGFDIVKVVTTIGTAASVAVTLFPPTTPVGLLGLVICSVTDIVFDKIAKIYNKEKAEELKDLVNRSWAQEQKVMAEYRRCSDYMKEIFVTLNVDLSSLRAYLDKVYKGLSTDDKLKYSSIDVLELIFASKFSVWDRLTTIADTICNWAKENPNVTSAYVCLNTVRENIKEIDEALTKMALHQ